jgi:signal peptidase I
MRTYHAGRERLPATSLAVACVIGAWLWWRWRPFRALLEGDSMRPTLVPGDVVVATARGRVRRGSLVVVERPDHPGFEMVKRVTALPGDVTADGVLQPGSYWVEGDDPFRSTDSRSFGPVGHRAIRGVVRFTLRARRP